MATDVNLFSNAEPPSNFVSDMSDSHETVCLLSTPQSDKTVLFQYYSHLTNDSVSYLNDKLNIAAPKSDKFTLHHPQNDNFYPNENCFKCPVCFKKKRNFFCPNCIRNGDFTHSKTNFLERFADKKLKFIKFKDQQIQMSAKVQKHFGNTVLKDDLVRICYKVPFLIFYALHLEFTNSQC